MNIDLHNSKRQCLVHQSLLLWEIREIRMNCMIQFVSMYYPFIDIKYITQAFKHKEK